MLETFEGELRFLQDIPEQVIEVDCLLGHGEPEVGWTLGLSQWQVKVVGLTDIRAGPVLIQTAVEIESGGSGEFEQVAAIVGELPSGIGSGLFAQHLLSFFRGGHGRSTLLIDHQQMVLHLGVEVSIGRDWSFNIADLEVSEHTVMEGDVLSEERGFGGGVDVEGGADMGLVERVVGVVVG
jgi:hypothetical protein